jgi:molybdopterin converting factor subunit 1
MTISVQRSIYLLPKGGPMEVRVRAFAALREALGFGERIVILPASATVADLLELLSAEAPALGLDERRFAIAVNRSFAQRDAQLADGDEVALIPPVSGGAARAT